MTSSIIPSIASTDPSLIAHHPSLDETRTRLLLPIASVTVLEDRAQVRREGPVAFTHGHNRLALWGVAPVLQDVSLRIELLAKAGGAGRVLDARVRRALRIGHKEKPEATSALERRMEELARGYQEAVDDQGRADERAAIVLDMMKKAMSEVPQDAAWSLGHPQTWQETWEALTAKARGLRGEGRVFVEQMNKLAEELRRLDGQRALLARPDTSFQCVIEVDVEIEVAAQATGLAIHYTVPNALWRPFHRAEQKTAANGAASLRFSSQAAVWQNTGEDWLDCDLSFSTSRSSLGHEPPKLVDDPLSAKKKDPRVIVAAREVAVANAGLGRGGVGGAATTGVQLPGVDDGGDVQTLRSQGKVTVPSDGRPSFIPVFDFESPAQTSLVVMAELSMGSVSGGAHFQSVQQHTGGKPMLAGPVELLRSSGFVGTTSTLFVAPGERFKLGFGSDDDVRVQRSLDSEEQIDDIDKWKRRTVRVSIFLSNLSAEEKQLEICERIPVSEIEHVKVTLVADKTSGAPELNEHGILTWKMALPGSGRVRLNLVYVVASAPGVQGL